MLSLITEKNIFCSKAENSKKSDTDLVRVTLIVDHVIRLLGHRPVEEAVVLLGSSLTNNLQSVEIIPATIKKSVCCIPPVSSKPFSCILYLYTTWTESYQVMPLQVSCLQVTK